MWWLSGCMRVEGLWQSTGVPYEGGKRVWNGSRNLTEHAREGMGHSHVFVVY